MRPTRIRDKKMEELINLKNEVATVVAKNKKTAEKYINEGSVGMLIFGFFWGWIKSFLYMFVALFKGSSEFGGGGGSMGGMFRFFRAIIETAIFPVLYAFRLSTKKKQKKQAEIIVENDEQTLKSVLENCGNLSLEELREKAAQVSANSEILKSFDKSKK